MPSRWEWSDQRQITTSDIGLTLTRFPSAPQKLESIFWVIWVQDHGHDEGLILVFIP